MKNKRKKAAKLKKREEAKQKTRKEEAFSKIFEMYQHDVYKISLFFAQNEEAAEEATQKTFYNFYLHFDDVKPECMRTYLFRSVRNMTFNWLRDRKLVREGTIEDVNDDALSIISVEDVYIREEEQRIAARLSDTILSRLYEENQLWYECIVLVYYLGKPNVQVAKELGVSKYVISSRLYRAKKWIRENFQEEYERTKQHLYQ